MNVTLFLPVISAVNFNPSPTLLWEYWPSALLTVFTVAMFLAVGCCVGSFLNVAIWRWPIGRGVTRGTSACPKCGTPILPRDNLPIFGWLLLRGRCRACREPISFRYPLVEAWTGLAFVAIWSVIPLTGGQTLPVRPPDYVTGAAWQIWSAYSPDLLYLATLYSVAMCQAVVLTMMTFDGARWRGNTAYVLLAIIAVAIVAEPRLHPLGGVGTAPSRWLGTTYPSDQWPANSLPTLLRADALASVLLALAAGIGLVQLLLAVQRSDRQQAGTDGRPDDHSAYTATSLNSEQDVGGTTDGVNSRWLALTLALVFGWKTAFALWGVAATFALLLTLVGPPRIARGPWTLSWTLALHLMLVSWRWAWTQMWWPGHPGPNVAAWLVVSLLLSLAVTQLQQRQGLSGTPAPSSPPAAM